MPPTLQHALETDLVAIQEAVVNGVTTKTAKSKDTHWQIWNDFCLHTDIDPILKVYSNVAPFQQIFAPQYRRGFISASGNAVGVDTVSNALCPVGQTFLRMGAGP